MKFKHVISGLLVAVSATVCFAFAQPTSETKTSHPLTGFFQYNADLGDQDDADAYVFAGETLPADGCTGSLIICTIEANVDDRSSANPEDWKPDFANGNPVSSPGQFSMITKRN